MGDGVNLDRLAGRLGLVVLLVIGGFLLMILVRKADHAIETRQAAAASAPPAAR